MLVDQNIAESTSAVSVMRSGNMNGEGRSHEDTQRGRAWRVDMSDKHRKESWCEEWNIQKNSHWVRILKQ